MHDRSPRNLRPWWLALVASTLLPLASSAPACTPAARPLGNPRPAQAPAASIQRSEVPAPFVAEPSAVVPVSDDDPQRGDPRAPVTIVTFSDFQCPFCQRVNPTLERLLARHPGQLRVVWKDLPLDFHAHARSSAVIARIAQIAKGDAGFWQMHDRLFASQKDLSVETVIGMALELGVTNADFARHRAEAERRVEASLQLAKRLAVQGTPNFFIDGELLTGARPFEEFEAVITAHLARAQSLRAQGLAAEQLYATMVKAYFVEAKGPEAEEAPAADPTVWKVPIVGAPARGPATALVTIVTYADFQCPFCKRLAGVLSTLEQTYGSDVRFVFRHQPLPFHKRAMAAAMFAVEARKQQGDAGFWKAHDALLALGQLEDGDLEGAARQLGLDVKKTMAAVTGLTHKAVVDVDVSGAADLGVRGTPHSFVNGRSISGAQPLETFKALVDEELAKAKAKVTQGVAAAKLYDTIVKDGHDLVVKPIAPSARAPWTGARDAKVVVHVFSDFQCPFCRRAAIEGGAEGEAGLVQSIKKYGNKLKVVWHNFPLPFHPRAEPVAQFAMEVFAQKGNAGFWKAHDAIFASQPNLEDKDLQAIANQLGVDWAAAEAAMQTHKYAAELAADKKLAQEQDLSGTPSFLVFGPARGTRLIGAQPAEAFFRAIDAALAQGAKPAR